MTQRRLGAVPRSDGSAAFEVWAPHAERVRVRIHTTDGEEGRVFRRDLHAAEHGYWRLVESGVPAGSRYSFTLDDDDLELPDPTSASQPDGVHAASAVVDLQAFDWTDTGWAGLPLRDYVIYELHVGTFTPAGTFDAIIPRLQQLAEDGITAIELLPVAEFPGGRNWGYDGVDLFAVQSTYGGPDGLRRLVDAAHAHGIAVVLDVVYNHLGPEGNYLARFGPYFSERHHTPWGAAVNVDGPGSDEVRRFFIENARQWVRDFHVDALRLDAVHGIVDTSASPFLAELADAVRDEAADARRQVHVIAESDLNDVRVTTPREAGGWGHDSQWTDDFHHALHVAATGESSGYYADFPGAIDDLATSLRRGFVYTGQPSAHRGRRFGSDSTGLPGERFVVYAQNHDQVGNRLLGDRLASSLTPARQRTLLAAVLLAPFVPMLFMGEEYGETRPFPYFTSHGDPDLVRGVREGRAREFASFGFAGEAPDPQGDDTFRSAVLDWDSREHDEHGTTLATTRALLRLRRESPSIRRMRPAEGTVRSGGAAGWVSVERAHDGDHTLVVCNLGTEPLTLAHASGGTPDGWHAVLDTTDPAREPSGVDDPAARIAADSAVVFRRIHGGGTT